MCGGLWMASTTAWATGSASGPVIGEHRVTSSVQPTVSAFFTFLLFFYLICIHMLLL